MGRVTMHSVHSFSPGIIIESIPLHSQKCPSGVGKLYGHPDYSSLDMALEWVWVRLEDG